MARILTIDGINGNFFGGKAYSANWHFNDGNRPSTLNVSAVAKRNGFRITDGNLSYNTETTVNLGNFSFKGYLIGYEIEDSATHSMLNLEYVDKSIILDKWSVGLYKRYSHKKGTEDGVPKNMIIVGKEYHPCDQELDSTVGYTKPTDSKIVDPCDPCPAMPAKGYEKACDEQLADFKIFPVYYTFNDLLSAIEASPVAQKLGIVAPDRVDNQHRAQHVGKLSSVLDTWCSELGMAYYWDPVRSTLNFVQRDAPISIPERSVLENSGNVLSLKYGETKAKTFSRGMVAYVGAGGGIKPYPCEREDAITLRPLTVAHLISNAQSLGESNNIDPNSGGLYDAFTGKYVKPTESTKNPLNSIPDALALEYSHVLAYYPSQLRLAFLWFYVHQILDYTSAQKWLLPYNPPPDPDKTGDQDATQNNNDAGGFYGSNQYFSAENGGDKTLYQLGNMRIVKVYAKQDTSDKGTATIFQQILDSNVVPSEYLSYVEAEDKKAGRDPMEDPSFYFIVAQVDLDLQQKQEQNATNIAQNFIGRYFYRDYDKILIAGNSNENTQLNIDAAGASAGFHPIGEDLSKLPVFSFGHTSNSVLGSILKDSQKSERDNIQNLEAAKGVESGNQNKNKSLKSFILVDRSDAAKYDPPKEKQSDWVDTWKWYENINIQLVGNNGRPDILEQIFPQSKNDLSLKMLVVRQLKNFNINVKIDAENKWEPIVPKTRRQAKEKINSTDQNANVQAHPPDLYDTASYGLMSRKTVEISVPGGLKIYPPAQSMSITANDSAGFRVFVKSNAEFKKVMPKVQYIGYIEPTETEDVANVDYLYKDVSAENIGRLIDMKDTCTVTPDKLKQYISKFGKKLVSTNKAASARASLRVFGLMPLSYSAKDGLSSVQITVSDNGIYTDYTFEDKIVTPPKEDIIQEQIIRQNKVHSTIGHGTSKYSDNTFTSITESTAAIASVNVSNSL